MRALHAAFRPTPSDSLRALLAKLTTLADAAEPVGGGEHPYYRRLKPKPQPPDEFIGDTSVFRIVETGSPSDRIAEVSAEVGADLTILGTHEYGSIHTHLLGTTTDRLLTKTSVPVLTLKL